MTEKVFVYGTLKNGTGKPAYVVGEMRHCLYYPTIKLGGKTLVKGEIRKVDLSTLFEWDLLEGYHPGDKNSLYIRRETKTTDGEEIWVYEGNLSWRLSKKMVPKNNIYEWRSI